MAKETDISLRSKVIYSVYVRNHSDEGDFKGVIKDLDRIKDLGVDIIWLMPIHPIGQVNKKGSLGCPYSIEDFRKVNPEYGTVEDFELLVNEIHRKNMKVIIDVVYNHTSHGSTLLKEHPEWFYRKANGHTGNKVGDWTDIIDLDYSNSKLWDYQIETLKYWSSLGVDGYRCDVASLIPIEFWKRVREEVKKVNADTIWLSESVDQDFLLYLREQGVLCHSDSEVFEAFDISYDYDTYRFFTSYLNGDITLKEYIEKKRTQEYIYPGNYVKLRFVENHDNLRAAYLFEDEAILKNWTAFSFFEKGTTLIYAGQEVRDNNCPNLFERDLVNWNKDEKYFDFIKKLITIKHKEVFAYGNYKILKSNKFGIIHAEYKYKGKKIIGIFNVESKVGNYNINLKDGIYINLIDCTDIEICNEEIKLRCLPIIFEVEDCNE
ncbi:MAG: alpha-amylase family glycosyl hydrolase [Clostridium beijerinckii]|jgi:glycosidase|nr:alpha-amylase family glycosyl hydrolase [Clostridium beijerinckii]MCI1578261.1 alpha-amylase family glycosyl hydrolase [Clostridium beijerinckii]MCI1583815.1 alpha-amylase family glycosyl hydrolase [Clostridium beijerinckii]MCI1621460.1 alpha-amylase family glycosyl hydrolase [Clostridium beijerinckii]